MAMSLSLSVILVILVTGASGQPVPVLDVDGKPVIAGVGYNIVPAFADIEMVLTARSRGLPFCRVELDVPANRETSDVNPLAVNLIPVSPDGKGLVTLSTDLAIQLIASQDCKQANWSAADTEYPNDKGIIDFLSIGEGEELKDVPQPLTFTVEKGEKDYKLVCCFPFNGCSDIVISGLDGRTYLALTEHQSTKVLKLRFRVAK